MGLVALGGQETAKEAPKQPERIQTERPSRPFNPVKIVFRPIGRGLNRTLLILEDKGIVPKTAANPDPNKPPARFSPLFGGLGDGAGIGGGIRFFQPIFGVELEATGRVSERGYQRYTVSVLKDLDFIKTGPEAIVQSSPQEDYWGVGRNVTEWTRSNYGIRERRLAWTTKADLRSFDLRHSVQVRRLTLRPGTDERFPDIQDFFPESDVEGGFKNSQWLVNEFGINVDRKDERDEEWDRRSGYGIDAALIVNRGLRDTTTDFSTLRLLNLLYIPLSNHRDHLIALRTEFVHNVSADPIPFYLQPALGGSTTLRGYREQRYRDRDSFATSVEYRYRIYPLMDAVVFGDAGQVYNNVFEDLSGGMHLVAGVGLRFHSRMLNFRITFGHSVEGNRTFLKAGRASW